MSIYNFLEKPEIYNLIQRFFNLGSQKEDNIGRCLLKYIPQKVGISILDIGCGTGKFAELFVGDYHGIDNNEEYIKYAKQNYRGSFLTMSADKLDFPDNKFDYIFSASVFHHLSDEQVISAVREMKRVCKESSLIVIIDAIFPSKWNFLGYMLFWLDRGRYTRKLEELRLLLEREGFILTKKSLRAVSLYKQCVFKYDKRTIKLN